MNQRPLCILERTPFCIPCKKEKCVTFPITHLNLVDPTRAVPYLRFLNLLE